MRSWPILPLTLACLAFAACSDDATPTAPGDTIVLKSTELLSGGEGLLRSTDFAEFELEPAVDADGAIVPNRWTNFSVEVDGAKVDSRRVATDRIAFEVPIDVSGTAAVDVAGDGVSHASFSVRRLGLVDAVRYDLCTYVLSPHNVHLGFVGLDESAVVLTSECFDPVASLIRSGYARLRPPISGSLESISEGSEVYPSPGDGTMTVRMYTPGTTFEPGVVVIERPVVRSDGSVPEPDLWRVRIGPEVEYVEPASCTSFPDVPFAVAELAEGVCLTVDVRGHVLLDGALIFETAESFAHWPPVRFETSSEGRRVLTHFVHEGWMLGDSYPVFAPDGSLEYTIDGYDDLEIVAGLFDPSGADIFVLAWDPTTERSILERRNAASGELRSSLTFGEDGESIGQRVSGVAFAEGRLWIVGGAVEGSVGAISIVEPGSLTVERSILFRSPEIGGYRAGLVIPTPGALLLPDATARRAYVVTTFDARMFGFAVDVF